MDFETLFTLLLIAIYVIVQLLSGRKRAPQPSTGDTRPEDRERSFSLDDALEEIQRALDPTVPESEPRPVPPTVQKAPPPPPLPRSAGDIVRGGTRDERHPKRAPASDLMRPLAEPPASDLMRRPEKLTSRPTETPPANARTSGDVLHRLRSSQNAREAILLSEILGPPRARRR